MRRRPWALTLALVAALSLAAAADALVPDDPLATHPAYAALNLPAAWEITTGSPDVVIAIVDSGVDPTHPDLAGAVLQGYDFVDGDTNASDPPGSGHGTAVAGAAAARGGNGIGGAGVCFGCSVMPLRVLGPGGIAAMSDVARAVDHAVDHGAAVVNASLYGENPSPALRAAIARARAAGVLVVAAAGNEANTVPQYPAAFPETIGVGAATYDGRRASFTSYGPWVGYAAPECAPVTVLGGSSGVGCMTSTSSPLVAGVVALMRAHDPYASADEVEGALTRAARLRPVDGVRAGMVDAAAALAELPRRAPRFRPVVLGDAVAGRPLDVLTGVWSGAKLEVRYRWERCLGSVCAAIHGAADPRYTPSPADGGRRLRVVVSAEGVDSAASAQTAAVAVAPRLRSRPSIAGSARVGSLLTAQLGRWEGTSLRYGVRWLRCRGPCQQAALGRVYRIRERDRRYRLGVEVIASNAVATASAFSNRTRAVP
jgi:Subtilase family